MLEDLINIFKYPITSTIQKSENPDTKYELIRGCILTAINALLSVLSVVFTIFRLKYYDFSEKLNKIKNAELFSTFFKTWIILAIVVAIVALIMFIICKVLKQNKEYSSTLSITNTSYTIFLIGYAANIILSLVFAPLGALALMAAVSLSTYTAVFSLRDSLQLEDSDKFVQYTVCVLTATVVFLVIVFCLFNDVSLKDLSDLSMLKYLF